MRLGAAALLAAVLVAAKAWILGPPRDLGYAAVLSSVTWEDGLLALAFAGALHLARERPRARGALVVLGGIVACGATLAPGIWAHFKRHLSWRMLDLVGNAANLQSSIADRLTAGTIVAFIGVPIAYAAGAWWLGRREPLSRRATQVVLGAAAAWVLIGAAIHASRPADSWYRRLSRNPHRELIGSAIASRLVSREVVLARDFPPAYRDDFRLAAAQAVRPEPAPGPRNVVFVILESTGAKYLSLYGSPHDTTPRLVAEAGNALVMDSAYSHVGYSFCSFMTLIYGCYPGLPWAWRPSPAPDAGGRPLPETLAATLRGRGYRTGFFHPGDLEWEGMGYMLKERGGGFEEVQDFRALGCPSISSWGTEDRCAFEALERWIDAAPGRPFFGMVWTDQTHDPYALSPGAEAKDFVAEPRLNRYLNAVRAADAELGKLFAFLRARGLAEETLVVITGDHGEAFEDPHADAVGHGAALYDECVRVPLVFWNPRRFGGGGGGRVKRVAGHVDINPTMADLLDVEAPADWQGASVLAEGHPGRAYFSTGLSDYQFGVRDGKWKYVLHLSEGFERLYDLEIDPGEGRDWSRERPEVCKELRGRVSAAVAAEEEYLRAR